MPMVDFKTAENIFNQLYGDVNGYLISSQARQKLSYYDKAHTYGEVRPDTFYNILSQVKPQPGEIFYDLGCGTGKPVILASFLFDFSKCVGIEILKDIWHAAESIRKRYESEFIPHLVGRPDGQIVEFVNGNFLEVDFTDADIVFAHSTCLHDELWVQLIRKLELLKPGARVITVTKNLLSPYFAQEHVDSLRMGWGEATVYYYKRVL